MAQSRLTQRPGEQTENEQVPIYTHTYVLGVDICVYQRGHDVDGLVDEIRAYGNEVQEYGGQRCRRDLAAWARRNLFSGQPTEDGEDR